MRNAHDCTVPQLLLLVWCATGPATKVQIWFGMVRSGSVVWSGEVTAQYSLVALGLPRVLCSIVAT